MKAQTLNQICAELGCTRVRVRDVTTFRDYVTLNVHTWGVGDKAKWYNVMCCEDGMDYTKEAESGVYVPLSSREEIAWLRRLKQQRIEQLLLSSYERCR